MSMKSTLLRLTVAALTVYAKPAILLEASKRFVTLLPVKVNVPVMVRVSVIITASVLVAVPVRV